MYKFGGQPFVNDYLNSNHKSTFDSLFGNSSKTMMHATAGRFGIPFLFFFLTLYPPLPSLIGIGEIVLLPLDALKIKMQISSAAYKGKTAFDIVRLFCVFAPFDNIIF